MKVGPEVKTNISKYDSLIIEPIKTLSLLCQMFGTEMMMQTRKIDILCITETWLSSHTPESFINIANYNVYRNDKYC